MADLFPAEGERVPFRVLASRAPHHDPATCTREPCGRCRPKGKPRTPDPVDHKVARQRRSITNPWNPLAPLLRTTAKVMPADLAKQMTDLADAIRDHGQERWERLLAWEHRTPPGGISLVHTEDGPDDDDPDDGPRTPAISLTEEQLRSLEHAASRYAEQARTAAARLTAALAPVPAQPHTVKGLVHQVRFHIAVAEARKNRRLLSREQTAAQVAADGWCRSCYRVDVFEPITRRDGGQGEPYYKDLCRWCGTHRGDLEQPPIDLLRLHHRIPERKRKAS